MRQAVILCGGRGERLRPLTDDRPKALVEVGGRPFLDHLLAQLERAGCGNVVLLSGYRANRIIAHTGDNWNGMRIQHSVGPCEWSTGRRLIEAQELLSDEFLLLYSDNYAHLDWDALERLHQQHAAAITLSVHRKSPGNVRINSDSTARYAVRRRTIEFDSVEVGYMLCAKHDIVATLKTKSERGDALPEALQLLSEINRVRALEVRGGYLSISSPERRDHAERALTPKRILLVDRDGTINERAPRGRYITTVADFRWRKDAEDAIRLLADRNFSFVVITNQAGVATGDVDPSELQRIHDCMSNDFQRLGANLLGVLCNTEHWSTVSDMRKPGPGMILEAAQRWQFHPERVMYVGDDVRDAETAYNAGSAGVLIGNHVGERLPAGTVQVQCFMDATSHIESRYNEVSKW